MRCLVVLVVLLHLVNICESQSSSSLAGTSPQTTTTVTSIECQGDCTCDSIPTNNICELNCNGKDKCKDSTLECPSGSSCIINCIGNSACGGNVAIEADGSLDMTIVCSGVDACKRSTIECGDGDCVIQCDDSTSCQDITVDASGAASLQCSGWCDTFSAAAELFTRPPSSPTEQSRAPTDRPTQRPTQRINGINGINTPQPTSAVQNKLEKQSIYVIVSPSPSISGYVSPINADPKAQDNTPTVLFIVIGVTCGVGCIVYGVWILYKKCKKEEKKTVRKHHSREGRCSALKLQPVPSLTIPTVPDHEPPTVQSLTPRAADKPLLPERTTSTQGGTFPCDMHETDSDSNPRIDSDEDEDECVVIDY